MTKSAMQNLIEDKTRRANRRLRDLERAGLSDSSNAYRYIKTVAYDDRGITSYTSTGKIKFRTDTKNMSEEELKVQLSYLDNFLTAKTSTVGGVNRKYKDAYNTFKQESTISNDISYTEFIDMYNYQALVEYQKIYGSIAMQELVSEYGVEKANEIAKKVLKMAEQKNDVVSLEEIEKIKKQFKKG